MSQGHKISDPIFNTDVENISSEIDALKIALAISIFTQPHEQAVSALNAIKSNTNPFMQKLYNELIQFSPANGV